MKIIIVGCGKVGVELCAQLSNEGHDIVVVDNDAKKIKRMLDTYDVMGVVGNGAGGEIQKEAGVQGADLIIACTASDELNILCCSVAKKLGARDSIARVRNPEYFNLFIGDELGLSMMVNPEREAAMEIVRILRFPAAIKVEEFAQGKLELVEYKVCAESKLNGLALKNLPKLGASRVLICAVERRGEAVIPNGEFVLETGDRIHITAAPAQIEGFFKDLGALKSRYKKIMILGGNRIAFYLADALAKYKTQVKVLENDLEVCRSLNESLSGADIINADGYDQNTLAEEDIAGVDVAVAISNSDEKNILISMFIANNVRKKVITVVRNDGYARMLEGTGVDSIISPGNLTANQIIRYVRASQNHDGGDVCTLFRIIDNKAEVSEFLASKDFLGANTTLRALNLKKGLIIAGIVRDGEAVAAQGDTAIKEGDRVLVVSVIKGINDLNDILD